MIVVDGRTDLEKLRELLLEPEQTHLEFKSALDLTSNKDKLEFVKDAVSMANRPPGGYIIVGAQEGGSLALPLGSLRDRALFDGARLGDLIRKHIEGEVHVVAQFHEVDGHEVVLIYLPHHRDGLPVPMSTLGQYRSDRGKDVIVFREGDMLVREGAKNSPLRHAHWHDLLSERDRRLRAESRVEIDSLLTDLARALRDANGPVAVPLSWEMSDEAFVEAVVSNLEANKDVRLKQFLGQGSHRSGDPLALTNVLDKITILAAQCLYFERYEQAHQAVDALFALYARLDFQEASERLATITRVYVLGSLAVRLGAWSTVHNLVLRQYPPQDDGYVYSSWIRHGQVNASRANLLLKDRKGMMISAARSLASERPAMRPDVPDAGLPDAKELAHDDVLFNSLCQFDVLYCLIARAEGSYHGGGYPASSAMHQYRADPAFVLVATDAHARTLLFPNSVDARVASAITEVFEAAERESFSFGGHWDSLPPAAQRFVIEHGGGQP